jgi:hypothetical protein
MSGAGELLVCCAASERLEAAAKVKAGISSFTFFIRINLRLNQPSPCGKGIK